MYRLLLALFGVLATATRGSSIDSIGHDIFQMESGTDAAETPVKSTLRGRHLFNADSGVCRHTKVSPPMAQPYSFKLDPQEPFYIIHIPKCAGGSAIVSM
jgi:hypothetical protein